MEVASQETPGSVVSDGSGAVRETLLACLVCLATAAVHQYLCLLVLTALTIWLVIRHIDSPADVLGMVFTLTCLTPLFRRVHDILHGYQQGSLILVGQFVAYPAIAIYVLKSLPKLRRGRFIPVLLTIMGILWAYMVGILSVGVFPASMQLLEFGAGPVVFAYLMINADRFDTERFTSWLVALGAFEGVYGVVQWVLVPVWDTYWFMSAGMNTAGGDPYPFKMRTFGTLNSTSPYAYFLFFVLVVGISNKRYVWAAIPMVAGLATTLGRSTWGAALIGWVLNLAFTRGSDRSRIATRLASMVVLVALLAVPFADRLEILTSRLQSMTNVQKDNSFKDRSSLLSAALRAGAFEDPVGVGFGMTGAASQASGKGVVGIDNGFLAVAWVFGWIGGFYFLVGVVLGMARGMMGMVHLSVARIQYLGAVLGLFAANVFESAFDGIKGTMVWVCIGITNLWIVDAARDSSTPAGSAPPSDPLETESVPVGMSTEERLAVQTLEWGPKEDSWPEPQRESASDSSGSDSRFEDSSHRGRPDRDSDQWSGRDSSIGPDSSGSEFSDEEDSRATFFVTRGDSWPGIDGNDSTWSENADSSGDSRGWEDSRTDGFPDRPGSRSGAHGNDSTWSEHADSSGDSRGWEDSRTDGFPDRPDSRSGTHGNDSTWSEPADSSGDSRGWEDSAAEASSEPARGRVGQEVSAPPTDRSMALPESEAREVPPSMVAGPDPGPEDPDDPDDPFDLEDARATTFVYRRSAVLPESVIQPGGSPEDAGSDPAPGGAGSLLQGWTSWNSEAAPRTGPEGRNFGTPDRGQGGRDRDANPGSRGGEV